MIASPAPSLQASAPTLEASTEDRIRGVLDSLVHERRELRRGTDRAALEANTIAIVYWQQELSKHSSRRAFSKPD
jgi:hypothetical protein